MYIYTHACKYVGRFIHRLREAKIWMNSGTCVRTIVITDRAGSRIDRFVGILCFMDPRRLHSCIYVHVGMYIYVCMHRSLCVMRFCIEGDRADISSSIESWSL